MDSTDNPEIEENDHSKKIEELKVKLFLTRTIDGLQKSIVPNEELSTKLVYMMDQSEHSEDDFETEYDSHEEISMEEEDRTTNKSYQWQSVDVTKKHQEVFETETAGFWFSCEPDGVALTTGPWLARSTGKAYTEQSE